MVKIQLVEYVTRVTFPAEGPVDPLYSGFSGSGRPDFEKCLISRDLGGWPVACNGFLQ